jgi:CRISPR-associated protein Cas1
MISSGNILAYILAQVFFFLQFQIRLFPESIRPEGRVTYKAYDVLNNVFNFAYYVLECRVHKAVLKAKLEPYLGFLHSVQFGKPSLVCDFQELYRYLIDDFLI